MLVSSGHRMPQNYEERRGWKQVVVNEQKFYCDKLGREKWTQYATPSAHDNLKKKIGFALYGPPENEGYMGYDDKQLTHILDIFGIILKNQNYKCDIYASFLYVFGNTGDMVIRVPVIRIPKDGIPSEWNDNIFIEGCGRVYQGWQDYLKNNTLPECEICYPVEGVYSTVSGAVQLKFEISAAGTEKRKSDLDADKGAALMGAGATAVRMAALFVPVAWPIAAGATALSVLSGIYTVGRNMEILEDRHKHQQSAGLDDPEARKCWLGIAGGVMGLASEGVMAAADRKGQVGKKMMAIQTVARSVAVGSCIVNGLGAANGLAEIIWKAHNKEKITSLDILQFTSAVLFFTNSVISARQAHHLINSAGENSTGNLVGGQPDYMSGFSMVLQGGLALVATGSAAMTVKEEFSAVCIRVRKQLIEITGRLLKVLNDYKAKGADILSHLWQSLKGDLSNFWTSLQKELAGAVVKLFKAFGVKHYSDIVIGGCKVLAKCGSGNVKKVAGIMLTAYAELNLETKPVQPAQSHSISASGAVGGTASGINIKTKSAVDKQTHNSVDYYDEISKICAKSADRQRCGNPAGFLKFVKFICEFVNRQYQKEKSRYEQMWEMVKEVMTKEGFDKKYGIAGNPNDHFLREVFKEFKNHAGDGFTFLKVAYDNENARPSVQEEGGQGFFDMGGIRICPFDNKRGLASNGMLSKEQYCEMAAELTKQHVNVDSVVISESGDTAMMQLNGGADVITVHCWEDAGGVSGIAAVLKCPSE